MGVRYALTFNAIDTGNVAGTFKTMAALIIANTAGLGRVRLRSLQLACAEDTGDMGDKLIAVQVKRIDGVTTSGTSGSTVSAANMPKMDPDCDRDAPASGALNYSAEPTTYETEPLWQFEFHMRTGFIKYWDAEDAPHIHIDSILGVLCAPRDAVAVKVSGTLEFEAC